MQKMRVAGLCLAGLMAVGAADGRMAHADENRAVDELSFDFSSMGGSTEDQGRALGGLKATFPLGDLLGVEIEGGLGNDDYFGAGGRLFWRDVEIGMVGLFGSGETFDGFEVYRGGIEGELFFGAFTIDARLGGEQSDGGDDGIFGRAGVTWYPLGTLALRAGVEATPNLVFGRLSGEWQPMPGDWPEVSLFASGEFGDEERYSVLAGLVIHLGENGPLIERHRRQGLNGSLIFNELIGDEAVRNGGGGIVLAPPPEEEEGEGPFDEEDILE